MSTHRPPAPSRFALLLSTLACALIPLQYARAAEFTVDSAEDSGEGSLRTAITAANASAGPHSIRIDVPGSSVVLSLASPLPTITAAGRVTVDASASPGFTIDGGNAHRIFRADGASLGLELIDLRLINGRASEGGCVRGRDNLGFELRVERVRFENCRAENAAGFAAGGAINVLGASLEILDSRFSGNSAAGVGGSGGAVFSSSTIIDLRDSRFDNNRVEGSGSSLREGGALAISGSRVDLVFVRGARFAGNRADAGSASRGGGLHLSCESCSVNLDSSYFGDNSASAGGAAELRQGFAGGSGVELRVVNSSFERNRADTSGGALLLTQTSLDLRSSSFQRNRAANGAHLATATSFNLAALRNSVFAAIDPSLGSSACQLLATPAAPGPRSGNLFADSSCGALSATGSSTILAGDLGVLDSAADALPVLVFASGSRTIDGGTEAGCPTEDARGNERPIDGDGSGSAECDVGAFEHPEGPLIFRNGFEPFTP